MKTYILLFRGINVGGKNILPMKALSSLLVANGCEQVETYIQSGNIVLKSKKKPGTQITEAIESKFGFKPEVMILEKPELEKAAQNNLYRSCEGKSVHFYFCSETPKPNVQKLSSLIAKTERYEIKGKVFYLFAPEGIGRSKLVTNIESCLGVTATGRNLNTVNKLLEMVNNV